jgi:hypothetical protein
MNSLETLARNFVVAAKAGRLLERDRGTVVMLRAKDATFSQIQDLLAQHGVIVSESSITRFCRTHLAETQRLRVKIEQEFDLPSGSLSHPIAAPSAPSPTLGRKLRDLEAQFESASSAMRLRFVSKPSPAVASMGRFGFEALGCLAGRSGEAGWLPFR